MDAGPPPGAWAARKAENLRMTRMPCAASPALSPADSRHRHQRLARAASHGWLIGAKSMVATSFPGWIPRLRSRHLSRGYSTSQPLPKASCSIRARASRVNWRPPRALMPRGQVPQDLLHRDRAQPRLALVPAALQHVLDLQPQPSREAAHVDPLAPEAGIGAGGGELAGVRPACAPPALAVGVAERRGRHRPPAAGGHLAGIRWRHGRHVAQGRQPAADAGPAGPVPLLEVLLA